MSLFINHQAIARSGYEITKAHSSEHDLERLYLAKKEPQTGSKKIDLCSPAYAAAFREFSEIEIAEEDLSPIVEFANKYGLLTSGIFFRDEKNITRLGESISFWIDANIQVKTILHLAQLVESSDSISLGEYFNWRVDARDKTISFVEYISKENINGIPKQETNIMGPALLEMEPPDLIKPAKYFIHQQINTNLKKYVHSQLLWDKGYFSSQTLHVVPENLLGSIWHNVSKYVSDGVDFRKCVECGDHFVVGIERGIMRKYCSDKCKSKAFRRRKSG